MKKFKLLIIAVLLMPLAVSAQQHSKTRIEEKIFKVGQEPQLETNIRFANTIITHWERSDIHVKFEITAKGKNESDADRMLDKYQTSFSQSGSMVVVEGSLSQDRSTNRNNNVSLVVKCYISLPKGTDLKLDSKYGNINIDRADKNLSVIQKYGDLRVTGVVQGKSTLNMGYGKAAFGEIKGETYVDIKYGNLVIDKVPVLNLSSTYTDVTIREIETLYGGEVYGKIIIGTINKLILTKLSYGECRIDLLNEELEIGSCMYSKLNVREVNPKFKQINIPNGGYSDMTLRIPKGEYKVTVMAKYGNTRIYEHRAEGTLIIDRGGSSHSATILINNNYGNVTITE